VSTANGLLVLLPPSPACVKGEPLSTVLIHQSAWKGYSAKLDYR
jgi:hypothetical protein